MRALMALCPKRTQAQRQAAIAWHPELAARVRDAVERIADIEMSGVARHNRRRRRDSRLDDQAAFQEGGITQHAQKGSIEPRAVTLQNLVRELPAVRIAHPDLLCPIRAFIR